MMTSQRAPTYENIPRPSRPQLAEPDLLVVDGAAVVYFYIFTLCLYSSLSWVMVSVGKDLKPYGRVLDEKLAAA